MPPSGLSLTPAQVTPYHRTLQQVLVAILNRQGSLFRSNNRGFGYPSDPTSSSFSSSTQPTRPAQKSSTESLAGMMQTRLLAQDRVSSTLQYASAIDLALRQATVAVDPAVRRHIALLLPPKKPFLSSKKVESLLSQALKECGPSVLLYNTGIRAYLRAKDLDQANALLQEMLQVNPHESSSKRGSKDHSPIQPTAASFTLLIHALLDTRPTQAITLYREMTRRSLVPKTASGYAVLLKVQSYLGDEAGVSRVWAEMHTMGIRPSPPAHSTHLDFWWARGNMDVCLEAFQAALRDKALPLHRQHLLTSLALAFAREGHVESAVQVLPFLKAPILPSVRRIIIKACFLQGEGWLAKHAWNLLAQADRTSSSLTPPRVTKVKESSFTSPNPNPGHRPMSPSNHSGVDPDDLEPMVPTTPPIKSRTQCNSWSEAPFAIPPHLAFSGPTSSGSH
ncbi:MAG: hypothetical protein DHS80DRAFT_26208 [Piptocephalis tieghemiana]|nr:MAG: hypothetical protein DHS80DRAFT_26208 [Piptocephalis tieghemiana]